MAYFKCKGLPMAKVVNSFSVATWATGTACAYWVAPEGLFTGVMVRYKTGSAPTSPTDGTLFYEGTGSDLQLTTITTVHGATKSGFGLNSTYYFSCFSYYTDSMGTKRYRKDTYRTAQWTAVSRSISTIKGVSYVKVTSSSTTLTVPDGVHRIRFFIVGSGAGGSDGWAGTSSDHYGGRGGGGGSVNDTWANVVPGQVISFSIGAEGARATAGSKSYVYGTSSGTLQANGGTVGGGTAGGYNYPGTNVRNYTEGYTGPAGFDGGRYGSSATGGKTAVRGGTNAGTGADYYVNSSYPLGRYATRGVDGYGGGGGGGYAGTTYKAGAKGGGGAVLYRWD